MPATHYLGVGLPDRLGSTDLRGTSLRRGSRRRGEWMCPLADCCVYSSVLPEKASKWTFPLGLIMAQEMRYTTARQALQANPPSCVFGVLQELGNLLWVMSPAWPFTHWLVWPQDTSPPRGTGVRESPLFCRGGTCSGSGLPVCSPWAAIEHRRAQQTLSPHCRSGRRHCPLLRPPFLEVAGLSEPVFTGEAWMRQILWVLWRLRLEFACKSSFCMWAQIIIYSLQRCWWFFFHRLGRFRLNTLPKSSDF